MRSTPRVNKEHDWEHTWSRLSRACTFPNKAAPQMRPSLKSPGHFSGYSGSRDQLDKLANIVGNMIRK